MQQFQMGQPIYYMQEFLNVISDINKNIPKVMPNGVFGQSTKNAVTAFQKEYDLPVTGEVDNYTWNKIIDVYNSAISRIMPACSTCLYPSEDYIIEIGSKADFYYPIESVIYALSGKFDNIDGFEISDVYDGGVVEATKQLQRIMNIECDGRISHSCWKMISRLYENTVMNNIFENADGVEADGIDKHELMRQDMLRALENENGINGEREGVFTPRLDSYTEEEVPQIEEETLEETGLSEQESMEEKIEESLDEIQNERASEDEENNGPINNTTDTNTTKGNNDSVRQGANERTDSIKKIKKPPITWSFF